MPRLLTFGRVKSAFGKLGKGSSSTPQQRLCAFPRLQASCASLPRPNRSRTSTRPRIPKWSGGCRQTSKSSGSRFEVPSGAGFALALPLDCISFAQPCSAWAWHVPDSKVVGILTGASILAPFLLSELLTEVIVPLAGTVLTVFVVFAESEARWGR